MVLDDTITGPDTGAGGEATSRLALAAPALVPSQSHPEHILRLRRWADPLQTVNICDELIRDQPEKLSGIGMTVVRQYQIDDRSRSEWLDRSKAAMDLAMQVSKGKTFPWPRASNVVYPLVTTAAIQFAARAYPAIVASPSVVKGVVIGDDKGEPVRDKATGEPIITPGGEPAWIVKPGVKQARAERIGQHMSWQLLEEQPEWEPETDRLLVIVPIVGCAFRKSLFDTEENRNAALLVLAQNLVINYRAKSLDSAPRITEEIKLYPYEVEESIRAGVFLEHSPGIGRIGDDEDAPIDYLEQHRRLDLDGDGYPEPYIVTVHKELEKVVRIVAGYEPEGIQIATIDKIVRRIEPVRYYTQYDFLPNPDGGIYGVGLGQLLNPINEAVNTTLNQIFDAATLQTSGGGFIGKGLNMHAGSVRFKLGEYKVVNALGSTVRESVVPLTFPGPSPVLFQLLGLLIDAGKEIGSNTEVLSGNQTQANVPATTTLALIEQGLKVFTAVYKRIYRSLKNEFDKQFRLNRLYLDKESKYRFRDEWRVIRQQDYIEGAGVEPIADPSMVSDLQQLARAEALKVFLDDPHFDGKEIRKVILTAMKVDPDVVDKILLKTPPHDPAAQAQAIKFALEEIKVKAGALNQLAQAAEHLANVDVAISEEQRMWLAHQFGTMKDQLDALGNGSGAGEDSGAGGAGSPPPGLARLAAPPGNGTVPPVPQ